MTERAALSARRIVASMKDAFPPAHTRVPVNLAEFSHLDLAAYDAWQAALEALGFRYVADYEILEVSNKPGRIFVRTFFRAMVSRDGEVQAAFYETGQKLWPPLKELLAGLLKLRFLSAPALFREAITRRRCADFASEFADGHFIVTSNAEAAGKLNSPPAIESRFFPYGTPLDVLLETHERRLASAREQGGAKPLALFSMDELARSGDRSVALKHAYRAATTGCTREELHRLSRGNTENADNIHAEILRLQDAERAAGAAAEGEPASGLAADLVPAEMEEAQQPEQRAREIRQLWERLFLVEHALGNETNAIFGLGASEVEIARAEGELGFALPEVIRASVRVYNGVRERWYYSGYRCYMGLASMPQRLAQYREAAAECPPFRCGAGARQPEFGAQLVPFASGLDNTAFCLDYNPGEGGRAGQVVAVCLDDASVEVVAANHAAFMEQGIRGREADLERRRSGADKQEKPPNEVSGPGCLAWLFMIPPAGVLALMWRGLRLAIPLGQREALEARMRAACKKVGLDWMVPLPPLPARPPKVRKAAAPGSIAALWYEIEDLNRVRGARRDWMFEAGASEQELTELEQSLGFALPLDLRELFTACAAHHAAWDGDDAPGTYSGFQMALLPDYVDSMKRDVEAGCKVRCYPGTRPPRPGAKFIPFGGGTTWSKCFNQMSALCYDLDPGEGGVSGQIVVVDFENHACRVVAPSLKAWLEQGIAKLTAGEGPHELE